METIELLKIEIDSDKLLGDFSKLSKHIDELKGSVNGLEEENEKLLKTNQSLAKDGKKNSEQYRKNSDLISANKKQMKSLNTEIKHSSKEYRGQEKVVNQWQQANEKGGKSINAMRKQLVIVSKEWSKLTEEEVNNSKKGKALTKSKTDLTAKLKELEKATGDNRRNVGNYTDDMAGLGKATKKSGQSTSIYGSIMDKLPASLKSASAGVKAFSASLMANPIGAIIAAVSALAIGMYKYSQMALEVAKQNTKVAQSFGVTRDEANGLRKEITKLSDVWGVEFEETLKSSSVFAQQFGITGSKALELIEQGFKKGANANGEFLRILKEYPTHLKEVGLSAEESIALISQTEQQGLFSDKGIDAIKESGLHLREMTKATADALDLIGLSSKEIEEDLKTGNKSMFDIIQTVSKQMKTLPPQSKEVGTAIADIFGGAGEDAGLQFLTSLTDINIELDELVGKASDAEIASRELTGAWSDFTATFSDEDNGIVDFFNIIRTAFTEILSTYTALINSDLSWWRKLLAVASPYVLLIERLSGSLTNVNKETKNWITELNDGLLNSELTLEQFNSRLNEVRREYARLDVKKKNKTITDEELEELKIYAQGIVSMKKAIVDLGKLKKKQGEEAEQRIKDEAQAIEDSKGADKEKLLAEKLEGEKRHIAQLGEEYQLYYQQNLEDLKDVTILTQSEFDTRLKLHRDNFVKRIDIIKKQAKLEGWSALKLKTELLIIDEEYYTKKTQLQDSLTKNLQKSEAEKLKLEKDRAKLVNDAERLLWESKLAIGKVSQTEYNEWLIGKEIAQLEQSKEFALLSEEEKQIALEAIRQKYIDKQAENEITAQELRDTAISNIEQGAQGVSDFLASQSNEQVKDFERAKNAELLMAGDDAKKKEEIEARYQRKIEAEKRKAFEREKAFNIADVIMSTAKAVIGTWAGYSEMGPAGTILAGIQTAFLAGLGGLQIATISGQTYADGGAIEIGGNRHTQGGTSFYGTDGTAFEAEKGEDLFILNRGASKFINGLSSINQLFGGKSFGKKSSFLESGGGVTRMNDLSNKSEMNTSDIAIALSSMPNPIVSVEEIIDISDHVVNVQENSNY